ncbi:retrovirus-related Pol polyprotein from transposon TNT 1-94 [Pyrus ussuriensis x Pyrus communis]|uniref:Retrovirus-related Pol polyprotein from transposon TNT 1-94 n=1 Tax=Pyrus ussuriensis x Pyrus communis TaxID=2448454 RepID=A0A5N5HHC9_9ROSA|nr:retrovirus-related Pol polyprotein from transposon TNT 1-94 [Pyrus ussuriensis x Pyrus communis]
MSGSGGSEVRTPVFSGENYEFWRIKMATIFKSLGLWNLVEKGIATSNPKKKEAGEASEDDGEMVAVLMKDAKALGIIQNAVSDQIFPRIANAEMRDDESLSSYLTRLNELINQMRTFGESLSNERLVQKVLISLSKPYDSICLVIENTKCLETVELQEVVAMLKSQEQRFDLHTVDTTGKAFSSFSVSSKEQNRGEGQSGSSQFQKNWNNKGKKWGSKPKFQQKFPTNSAHNAQSMGQIGTKPQCRVCSKFHFGECRYKGKPKCYNCEKFGHWARECTVGKLVQKANSANQVEVTGNLFYANSTITESKVNGEWYVDSGCSNHMTGDSKLLIDMKTNVVGKVQMPTGELMNVAGFGTLVIDTSKGRKYVKEVMYLPGLKENLLSVGQMDEHGYYLLFGGKMCSIFDGPSLDCLVLKVEMKKNRCYPLTLIPNDQVVLRAGISKSTWIWHKRLGHLHFRGLQQLKNKEMVHGLPVLEEMDEVCEGCQFGKQHREWFPKNQAWRASKPLELVHVDLCGPMQNDSLAGNKYFIVYDPLSKKLILSRDVVFDENAAWEWKTAPENYVTVFNPSELSVQPKCISSETTPEENDYALSPNLVFSHESVSDVDSSMRRTQAFDHTPLKWRNLDDVLAQCNLCIMEPEKFEEAAKDEAWMKAMQDELSMIEKNATWDLVNRPSDKPIIGVKWVFKTKLNLDGTVQKHKARLVAKGYAQKPGVDYNEPFAPVARLDTIRTLIALAAQKSWKLYQLDVKSAFLNGVLEEEAPRAWYSEIDTYFAHCGFVKSQSEATLYIKARGGEILIVSIYVDDIVYTGNSIEIECKFVFTPLVSSEKLCKDDGSGSASEEQYRRIMGSLLYLTATRPDIMYIKGTLDYGLEYVKGKNAMLIGFCDSDWGGSVDDSKSTSGYAFSFGSGVFSWASVKQNCVALSTAEAEYISASEATAQAIWLRFVLEDFGEMQTEATPVHCDNTAAIAITKNPVFHQKTKHIDRRFCSLFVFSAAPSKSKLSLIQVTLTEIRVFFAKNERQDIEGGEKGERLISCGLKLCLDWSWQGWLIQNL